MSHFWCSKLPVILIAASVLITGCSGKSTIPETETETQTEPETAAVSALPTTTDTDTKDTENLCLARGLHCAWLRTYFPH